MTRPVSPGCEQGERNRALVLAAARRVFLERGYAGATLEAIADEAGFSKGVVYSQFAGKPDLFLALLERPHRRAGRPRTRASRPAWPAWTGCVPCWTPTPASPRRVATGPGCSSSSGSSPRAIPASTPGTPRCTPRPSITSPRRSTGILARAGLTSAYPPRAFAELILAIDAGRVLERAAGTSELRLEHLVDLFGRALVPAADDDTDTNTAHPGGHDAHHDRTEALVPPHSVTGCRPACWPATRSSSNGPAGIAPRSPPTSRTGCEPCCAHAVEHSPFHARRLRGIDPAAVDARDLSQLPVMTKADMMAELDDVFTDPRLTRRRVERALADAGPEPATLLGSYLALASGGSSGQRGVFVLDRPAAVQFFGSLSRGLVARLEAMGGPPPGGLPIAMVAAGSPVHATGIAAPLCQGETGLPFRFLGVPVTQPLSEIVERLNALQAPALYGYPSVLARLAREQEAGRLRISPMMVTSTSETCTPELRAAISAGFGAPLIDSFGSTEGLVGSERRRTTTSFTFAEDGCIVELVDERRPPGPAGHAVGGRPRHEPENRLQPLIRYQLTDTLRRAAARCRSTATCGPGWRAAPTSAPVRRRDRPPAGDPVGPGPRARGRRLPGAPDRRGRRGRASLAPHGTDCAALRVGRSRARWPGPVWTAPRRPCERVPELPGIAGSGKLRRFVPLLSLTCGRRGAPVA